MMNVSRALLVASTLVCVPVAHASLIFAFSFDSSAQGDIAGPITGEIHLVDVSDPQEATKFVITGIGSHPPQFGHPIPFVVIKDKQPQDNWSIVNNSFKLKGTSIELWNFEAFHDHLTSIVFEQLQLGSTGALHPIFTVGVRGAQNQLLFRSTNSSEYPDFILLQPAGVPTPSVLALLGIGCVGLCLSRRRKPAVASI